MWRQRLPWINKEIKQLIEQKYQLYKRFIRSNKTLLYINQFKSLQDELVFVIEKSKSNYYSKLPQKLLNKATNSKAYCSILKPFLNNKRLHAFCLYFMIMNVLLILEKKLNFLIYFLQSNIDYQRIIVSYQKISSFLLKNV